MSLASIIISIATKEIAGFTVGGYLAEKAADVGTGKIWEELKKKIGDKTDTFEFRLYEVIEETVNDYFGEVIGRDISAAICERFYDVWCRERDLTPERIDRILRQYSEYAKHDDILEWYRSFQIQVAKDDILYSMFMVNNMQLFQELQKKQVEKLDHILDLLLKCCVKCEEQDKTQYPVYLSDIATDIDTIYISRSSLENQIWNDIVLSGRSILLYGIGGIGKTEVAKAVLKKIYLLPSDVTGIDQIIWVNYTNDNLKDSLIEAVNGSRKNKTQDEAWEDIYHLIQTQREKLLIVIDNVENFNDDQDIERLGGLPCRVLVTSRVDKIGGLHKYSVDSLSKEVCREIFYYHYVGNHDDYYLNKILQLIDCHTVMLELLAKTANMEEKPLQEFYDMLVQNGFRLSDEKVDSGHPSLRKERRVTEQLKILFTISKCRIQDKNLLCQLSVIPAIPFQYKTVKNWIEVKSKSQLEYLVKTGWIMSDGKLVTTYVMHSVIASAIRFQNEEHLYEKCRFVIHSLSKELECSDEKHGAEKAYLIPFSWSISDVLRGHLCDEEDAEFLVNLAYVYFDIGNYENVYQFSECALEINTNVSFDIGNYEKVYQFFERALEINTNVSGADSVLVSSDYYNLAQVSYSMYQFPSALSFSRKSLAIRKKYYSSNDIEIIVLIKMMAGIYVKLNRPDRAERLYAWAAEKFENNPKTDFLQLSTHYSDMATFYRERGYSGDYEKAERYYQKAESGMKKVYGSKLHPEIAAFYDEKALLYDNMGKYMEALSLLKESLSIKEKTLEEEHPDIVQSYGSIGLVYYELTEYEKALDYLNKALDIADKIWSGPFSFKADIYTNLGLVYRSMGNYQKAEDFYHRALHIREEIYSPNHPLVLASKNNIAQIYASEERYQDAIELYETIIHDYKGDLSVDSTFLATVNDNLSNAYRQVERYEDAISACWEGWRMRKKILGERSVDSALSMNNLALIYYEMGALNEALDLFRNALDIKKEKLPPKHGQISTGYFNLGLVYDKLHWNEEALENYRASMEIDNELGAYEDVLLTAEYVAEIYERNNMPEMASEYRSLRSLCSENSGKQDHNLKNEK